MLAYLARHGETDENLQHIVQGQLDTQLNAHGIRQAKRIAERLASISFDFVYSSDLARAKKTADLIFEQRPSVEVLMVADLRERYMGSLQGLKYPRTLPPDVEQEELFVARIMKWWDSLVCRLLELESSPNTPERMVLIVSHGAWMGSLLKHLKGDRGYEIKSQPVDILDKRPWYLENGSLQVIRVNRGEGGKPKGVIIKWGDVEHLKGTAMVGNNADLLE